MIPTPSLDGMIEYVDATAHAHHVQIDLEYIPVLKEYHIEQAIMYDAISEQLYRLKGLES